MTIGTAPLRNRELEIIEAGKDAQTIANLKRDLLLLQQERIAELERELNDVWRVARAALTLRYFRSGSNVIIHESLFDPLENEMDRFRAEHDHD